MWGCMRNLGRGQGAGDMCTHACIKLQCMQEAEGGRDGGMGGGRITHASSNLNCALVSRIRCLDSKLSKNSVSRLSATNT